MSLGSCSLVSGRSDCRSEEGPGSGPSAVFAPSEHGHPRYRTIDRSLCIAVKFLEYSLAGLICGFAGQGFANGMMTIK